jgi:hypothetical protein
LAGEADKVIDGGGVMHLLALARALAPLIAVGDRDGDVHIGQLDAGNLSAQVVRQQACFLAAAQGGNRELVAAPAAHHIGLRVDLAHQELRHAPQHLVAHQMPVPLVERTEVVQIEKQDGDLVAFCKPLDAPLAQVVRPGQPCHRVITAPDFRE